MKSTGIKVTEVSYEEMLNDTVNSSYNVSEWKKSILLMKRWYPDVKFYRCDPDEHTRYVRFFASYTIPEGLHILTDFNPFCSSLSNAGFKLAYIIDGEIFTKGFGHNSTDVIKNIKEGRRWLVNNFCKNGTMASSSF